MKTFLRILLILVVATTSKGLFAQTIAITATHDTICSGDSVTFTATVSGTSNPHYQWLKNSVHVGTDTSAFTTSTLNNSDVIMCILDTTAGGSMVALSAPIVMAVYHTPHVDSIVGLDSVCRATTITLTDDSVGGIWLTNNPLVAGVNPLGIVRGNGAGVATIFYVINNYCGTDTARKDITVHTLPVVSAITGPATICIGATAYTYTDSTLSGTWTSSTTAVATINSFGVVTTVSIGTTVISYEVSNSCGTTTRTRNVTVNGAPVATPIVGTTILCPSDTAHLHATPNGGVWSSDNTSVALVSNSGGGGGGGFGLLAGISAGNATIKYRVANVCGADSTTAIVTVNPIPVVYPILGKDSVCPDSSTTLLEFTSGGTWASGNATIASVVPSGTVTGLLAGVDTIFYSVTNSCATTTQSFVLYVHCPYNTGVENVLMNNSISVYPNPSNDFIHVEGIGVAAYSLTNLLGEKVLAGNTDGIISVEHLPVGLYLVRVFDAEGRLIGIQRFEKI